MKALIKDRDADMLLTLSPDETYALINWLSQLRVAVPDALDWCSDGTLEKFNKLLDDHNYYGYVRETNHG